MHCDHAALPTHTHAVLYHGGTLPSPLCLTAQAEEAAKAAAAKEKEKMEKARQEQTAKEKKKAAEVEAKVQNALGDVCCYIVSVTKCAGFLMLLALCDAHVCV